MFTNKADNAQRTSKRYKNKINIQKVVDG